MKRLLLFLFLGMNLLTPAFSLQPEVKVSPQSLNFGHEGSEKTLYITNTSPNSDLFWSVKSTAPWLKVEPATGHIENPSRIPANASYSQVNLVYYKRRGMQWGMIGKEEITVEMNFVNGLYQARFKPKTLDIGRYGYYIQTQDNAGNWKSTPVYSLTVTTKKP